MLQPMPPGLSPTALLAILQPWADVAEPIHRRLAQLADAERGQEVLWIGCGSGRSVLWWARRFQTHIEGIDPDHAAIDTAERAARDAALARLARFQVASATDLPHEEAVFDLTVVDMFALLGAEGDQVLREAGRVARPMSTVLALVPAWFSTPEREDAALLQSIGLRPQLLVEWKSFFRDAGMVELSVEDTASDGGWVASGWIGLVVRGWRAARWSGVRAVFGKEVQVLRTLASRRVLGLSIVKGTRWPHG